MTRDPMAIAAAIAAARVLGKDCILSLSVDPSEIDAVSRLVCDVMGVGVESVKYEPPTETRPSSLYAWYEDGDGRPVIVHVHVLTASANDNAKEATK